MRRKSRRLEFGFAVAWVAVGLISGLFWLRSQEEETQTLPEPIAFTQTQELSPVSESAEEQVSAQVSVVQKEEPASINLAVPFTSQAPFANWDLPYQEACEEASILMVNWYYLGVEQVSAEEADRAILDLVAFEEAHGFPMDLTAEELAELIGEYFGFSRVDILEDPTVELLQSHLAQGQPVIVPAAGRLLENPYFRSPGPIYHMLVLRGYTEDQFVTNDPGTRHGEAYLYSFDVVMSAMHDWNGGDVEEGAKHALVIYP